MRSPDGRAVVVATSEPCDATLDTPRLYSLLATELREGEVATELAAGHLRLADGSTAPWRQSAWTRHDGQPMVDLQLCLAADGQRHVVTATTPADAWPDHEGSFRRILGALASSPPTEADDERSWPSTAPFPTDTPSSRVTPGDGSDAAPMLGGELPPLAVVPPSGSAAGGLAAEFERPLVSLVDVAGLDDVKRHIDSVVLAPLRHPELASRFGRSPSGGLLLWGPPGVGKTYLARALAGSLDLQFTSVGMDDILDMWLGSSERNLASLFDAARAATPCILFIDEIDALGGRRSRLASNASMRSVVSQLLVELDGATKDNTGVFVVGATNLPWDIDPALRRPGRFDRTVFVPPPDRAARTAILAMGLATLPLGDDLRLDALAATLAGRSGADVAQVAETAATLAFEETLALDRPDPTHVVPIGRRHLDEAARRHGSSIADWLSLTTVAAESSNDVALFEPFLRWLDRKPGE